MNNITSICSNTDYEKLSKVLEKYEIYIPSSQDLMDCITYSTNLYWRDLKALETIRNYVEKLTPIQRAAFLYTGDFYHLAKHNRDLSMAIITILSTKIEGKPEDPLALVKNLNEEHVNHARAVCKEEADGMTKVYADYVGDRRLEIIASTAEHITNSINHYGDLIQTLWASENVPSEVAFFPQSMRRYVLTGDTDSTIFTVHDWVKWYYQAEDVKAGSTVSDTMIFLAAQTVTHLLAKMSANFGVVKERLFQIAMKNEYKFDAYAPTNVAKHYFATKNIQEGIILNPQEYEIKGVHLKNSNSPKVINQKATEMMKRILEKAKNAEKIKIVEYLKEIADIERDIKTSIEKGDTSYLRLAEIKNPTSYSKSPMQSPYMHHMFWNEVFGPKYGTTPEPPYATVRLSSVLDNAKKTADYLQRIEDKELSERLKNWFGANSKEYIPSLMIPVSIISVSGMPKELLDIIDIRRIVSDITKVFYLIMETVGFYMSGDALASDFY